MSDVMQERYGAPSATRRRGAIIVSGVIGVVALAWLGWAAWAQAHPDVQSKLQTFSIPDQHRATARVAVRLGSDGVRASCLLRATAEDHVVVGERDFTVTGEAGTTLRDVDVRTEREATTVELVGCTTADQRRPR